MEATPEVSRCDLTPEAAFIVMASDGLWDVVSAYQPAVTHDLAGRTA